MKSGLVIISEMYSGSLLAYLSNPFLLCSVWPFVTNSRAFENDVVKDAWETAQIENKIALDLQTYDIQDPPLTCNTHSTIK